jgi:ubiquitin-protein ligase
MEKVLENSAQHIKDFKLAIEFKYLMKNSPTGVYLLPEFDDIRVLHGVIFIRRGLYHDGIFRFIIKLPKGLENIFLLFTLCDVYFIGFTIK